MFVRRLLTDEMCSKFANMNIPEFWKSCNAKFRKNVNKHVTINGYTNDAGIANEFAEHFNKVFCYSSHECTANIAPLVSVTSAMG